MDSSSNYSALSKALTVFTLLSVIATLLLRVPWNLKLSENQAAQCNNFVRQYLEERRNVLSAEQDASKMLFFLHVPRTAGRTYHQCFLKTAHPPSRRCAPSYDVLRLNISYPGCNVLSSHDDISISDFYSPEGAVITQLRKPVDRVISAYEFAIDVAARSVRTDMSVRPKPPKPNAVSTLNVWPWSHLVPWFRRDIEERISALRAKAGKHGIPPSTWLSFKDDENQTYYWSRETNESVWELPDPEPSLDPYNNPLVTPLHEWIELPIAKQLVHNGAVVQILGLTNYSHWPEHDLGRECLHSDAASSEALLGLAMKRLLGMKHVGTTERLHQSVLSLAAELGLKMGAPTYSHGFAALSYDAPDADLSALMTFNSSIHQANISTPIRAARKKLKSLSHDHVHLTKQLRRLLPELKALMKKEQEWVVEQLEKKYAEEGGGEAAAEDAAVQTRAEPAEAAEVAAGRVDDAAFDPDARAEDDEEEEGGAGKGGTTAEATGGGEEEVKKKGSKFPRRKQRSDLTLMGGVERRARRSGRPKYPRPPVLEDRNQGSIHGTGPWHKEIEELDLQVSKLQYRMKQVEWDMWSIETSGGVRTSNRKASGPASLVLPDAHFVRNGTTLRQSYLNCTASTKKTHTSSRSKVLKKVVTPWHESFEFTKAARAKIAPAVLDRILQLNRLDAELWELGDRLLSAKIAEQEKAGVLETLELPSGGHGGWEGLSEGGDASSGEGDEEVDSGEQGAPAADAPTTDAASDGVGGADSGNGTLAREADDGLGAGVQQGAVGAVRRSRDEL